MNPNAVTESAPARHEACGQSSCFPEGISSPVPGPTCYLCGSPKMVAHQPTLDGGVHTVCVLRCLSCDLVQNHPRLPKDYSRLSPQGSTETANTRHWKSFEDYERQQIGTKAFLADWVEATWRMYRADRTVPPTGLEVGCNTGLLLHLLSQRQALAGNWIGVDPDAEAATWGRNRYGATINAGYLNQVALEPRSVDMVLMMEVLEHSPDPLSLLHESRRLMKSDALLLVVVPDVKGCHTEWEFIVQEHMFHFSTITLRRLAEGAGFAVLREQESNRPARFPKPWIQILKRYPSISRGLRKWLSSPFARWGRGTLLKPGMIMAVYRAAA